MGAITTDKGRFTTCLFYKEWSWDKNNPKCITENGNTRHFNYKECYHDAPDWVEFEIVTLLSETSEEEAMLIVDESKDGLFKDYTTDRYTLHTALKSLKSLVRSNTSGNIVRKDFLILKAK